MSAPKQRNKSRAKPKLKPKKTKSTTTTGTAKRKQKETSPPISISDSEDNHSVAEPEKKAEDALLKLAKENKSKSKPGTAKGKKRRVQSPRHDPMDYDSDQACSLNVKKCMRCDQNSQNCRRRSRAKEGSSCARCSKGKLECVYPEGKIGFLPIEDRCLLT
jgi:hypothetical protein